MSNAVTKASVVLGVDGANAKTGLANFQKDMTKWADGTVKQMRGQFQEAFTGGLLGGFFGANFSGLVQAGVKSFGEWAMGTTALKKGLAETIDSLKHIQAETARASERSAEWRAVLLEPADKIKSIDKDFRALTAQHDVLVSERALALAHFEQLRDRPRDIFRRWAGHDDIAAEKVNAYTDAIAELDARIAKLGDEFSRLTDRSKDLAFVGEITKSTLSLRDQITTWGLTGEAAERARFKAAGATDAMLAKFDAATAELTRLRDSATMPWVTAMLAATDATLGAVADQSTVWLNMALTATQAVGKLGLKPVDWKLQFDNAGLQRGSSAEVSARSRYEMGSMVRDQLAEQKRANVIAGNVLKAIEELPAAIVPALLSL